MTITTAKIGDLTPDDNNANKGTERGRYALEKSLIDYGFGRSILIDRNGRIIAGNKTHEVAGAIGLEDVIVVQSDGQQVIAVQRTDLDISDLAARELAIADNRVGQLDLEWDADVLKELEEAGADLRAFWTDAELNAIYAELTDGPTEEEKGEIEEDETPDVERVSVRAGVEVGSIWQLGRHRIMCGDSTIEANVKALLGDKFGDVGMVWADPPYGLRSRMSWGFGDGKQGGKAKRGTFDPIINDDKPYNPSHLFRFECLKIIWGANHFSDKLPVSSAWLVWDKREGVSENDQSDAELAWVSDGNTTRVFRHLWNGMLKASERGQKRVHPTQKPIALCEWALEKYGQPDDIIFDPFLGSAPSVIAAQKMEGTRTVYGMELSPEYIEVILQRWENYTGEVAKRVDEG